MSRFYASIQGNRSKVTRRGTAQSGISGHIRGWNSGIRVECFVDKNDHDIVEAYATGGSNNNSENVTGLIFRSVDGKRSKQ